MPSLKERVLSRNLSLLFWRCFICLVASVFEGYPLLVEAMVVQDVSLGSWTWRVSGYRSFCFWEDILLLQPLPLSRGALIRSMFCSFFVSFWVVGILFVLFLFVRCVVVF